VTRVQAPYVEWSPLPGRAQLTWPAGARVAVCVVVSLERLQWFPGGAPSPPSARYGGPYPLVFDPLGAGLREYGNRVGVFRVMDVLDRHGIRATVAMDSALAVDNPFLVNECVRRGWEHVGHGVVASRMVTDDMSAEEERAYLRDSIEALAAVTETAPRGWLGVDYVESSRTIEFLAEMGIEYVCDRANDEQPYLMQVGQRRIVSLPTSSEADDVLTHRFRGIPIDRWAQLVCDTFDGLYADGAINGRFFLINLHPYLIGQPFRIPYLASVIGHIANHRDVWFATGSEVVDWYMEQLRSTSRVQPGDAEPT